MFFQRADTPVDCDMIMILRLHSTVPAPNGRNLIDIFRVQKETSTIIFI